MPSYNQNKGAKEARLARVALGLQSDGPVPDLLETVEGLAPVAVLKLIDGIAGAWIHGTIFVNASHIVPRQRFTLAHEFGHLRMDHRQRVDSPTDLASWGGPPEEVQANAFASEFLMPKTTICERYGGEAISLETVAEISCEYGVSGKAALIRLKTAGMVEDPLFSKLDAEILDGHVTTVCEHNGWESLDDSMTDLDPPHLPERPSALASFLAGRIGLEQFAAITQCTPEQARGALRRLGFL